MTASTYNVLDYGAVADGKISSTQAINRAIEACASAGGGTVVVPPGAFLSGPVILRSNVTFHLEAGAILLASANLEDYPHERDGANMESVRVGLVTARHAENVSITGKGIIDGSGYHFVVPKTRHTGPDFNPRFTRQGEDFQHPRFGTQHGPWTHTGDRPGSVVCFFECRNVHIQGVTIANSPTWTVHINHCEIVTIHGVRIHSMGSDRRVPNDDGIDLRFSRRVHISDCDFEVGDDCVAVFSSQEIVVTNCTMRSRSAGVRIGYDECDIRDCVFSNLVIHSNRGLNICLRGEGNIENILFQNIVMHTALVSGHWWGKAEPVHISTGHLRDDGKPLGRIRHVRFANIVAESEAGILISGCPESPIEDVRFDSIRLLVKNSPLHDSYGGNFDLRALADLPRALYQHDIPALFAEYTRGLQVHGANVDWEAGLPEYFTHAVQCENFADLTLADFQGSAARPGLAPAVLAHGKNACLRDCRFEGGSPLIDQVEGMSIK
ncbi:MAG: right-handed parallel beta-helix repeat-containing protein [Anaerolineaceae bacterium]|nr:right-handed parallel beta-helix repeat-containing protein [Anaerolineaceae bacterium]